jgi:hypothetical protein
MNTFIKSTNGAKEAIINWEDSSELQPVNLHEYGVSLNETKINYYNNFTICKFMEICKNTSINSKEEYTPRLYFKENEIIHFLEFHLGTETVLHGTTNENFENISIRKLLKRPLSSKINFIKEEERQILNEPRVSSIREMFNRKSIIN